jgi:hypothetical protein
MPRPTTEQFEDRFAVGLALDHLWSETMGLPIDDKGRVLASLVEVLRATATPYAVIGGVAVQLYTEEPRTTADLDIAVRAHEEVPHAELSAAGFTFEALHEWSENWRGPAPAGTPLKRRVLIQFSPFPREIEHAQLVSAGDLKFPLVALPDLVLMKLASASDPGRRTSKRLRDKTDVVQLLEEHPELATEEVLARLESLRL